MLNEVVSLLTTSGCFDDGILAIIAPGLEEDYGRDLRAEEALDLPVLLRWLLFGLR